MISFFTNAGHSTVVFAAGGLCQGIRSNLKARRVGSSGSERPARMLEDIISVPLPPADWEGKKDPKYKVQKRKRED